MQTRRMTPLWLSRLTNCNILRSHVSRRITCRQRHSAHIYDNIVVRVLEKSVDGHGHQVVCDAAKLLLLLLRLRSP